MILTMTAILILAIIFLVFLIWVMYHIGLKQGAYKKELEWQEDLNSLRRNIADKQRVGIKGQVVEKFAPFLPDFPFKASECKFLGDPIDYVVFEGLDERDIKAIHLVEVKNSNSKLSKHQKQIKDIVDNIDSNKFTFEEYRFCD